MTCGEKYLHAQTILSGGTPSSMPIAHPPGKQRCPQCGQFASAGGGHVCPRHPLPPAIQSSDGFVFYQDGDVYTDGDLEYPVSWFAGGATSPDFSANDFTSLPHPFRESELDEIFEFARLGLADADNFDRIVEETDLSDAYLSDLRDKLQGWMNGGANGAHPFNETEMGEIFEFARLGLADADNFDRIAEEADLSDAYLSRLRSKLQRWTDRSPMNGAALAAGMLDNIYDDLGRDYWEQGYTEDDVDVACERLNRVATQAFGLPGEIAVMWAENDDFGFRGDSDLVYVRRESNKVETYSLPIPFWNDSNPNDFVARLSDIAAGNVEPDDVYLDTEVTSSSYNWGPWPTDEWADEGLDEDDIPGTYSPSPLAGMKTLVGADLSKMDLGAIDLSGNDLREAKMTGVNLRMARMVGADMSKTYLFGADLAQSDLSRAKLAGAVLTEANLQHAIFKDANLNRAKLLDADMRNANLQGAGLYKANLSGANLQNADLEKAKLNGADLGGAVLNDARMRLCNLKKANLQEAQLRKADLVGADMQEANLDRADLTGANLRSVNLTGADLTGADLRGANLEIADLTGARLMMADLRDVSYSAYSFKNANLSWANMEGVDLTGTAFDYADLSNAKLSGATLVILPRANLSKADLTYADLRDANLMVANLSGADLRGAKLNGVTLSGADLRSADLSGADLRGARLTKTTNLSYCRYDDSTKWPAGFTPPPSS